MRKHKYLSDIGLDIKNTPYGWCEDVGDKRERNWQRERYTYGFDQRETWSLDLTLICIIYERLKMYDDVTNGVINKDFHIFNYNDTEYTQQQLIDIALDKCKKYLLGEDDDFENINNVSDVFDILKLIWRSLWW